MNTREHKKFLNKKLIFAAILLVSVSAAFLFADKANAQTAGTVTKQDLENIIQLQEELRDLRTGLFRNYDKTDPRYLAKRTEVMQVCKGIGDRLLQATGNKPGESFSTLWSSRDTCYFGLYLGSGQPEDRLGTELGRTIVVVEDSSGEAARLNSSILTNDDFDSLTLAQYKVLKAKAEQAAGTASSTSLFGLDTVIGGILKFIFSVLSALLLVIVSFAGWVLSYFTSETTRSIEPIMVEVGWTIMRDLMNMVFVFALIVISLATILRIETYNYKKLIFRLVLMALLINFSKAIADALIGFVDLIVQIFTAKMNLVTYGERFYSIVNNGRGVALGVIDNNGALKELVAGALQVITILVMVTGFLAVALLLLIRMVGLWVLVILSPVAYALNILPATSQYARQWWQTFFKYLIWAPIAIFFLFLGQRLAIFQGDGTVDNSLYNYILISAFLWAAVIVAQQAGMVGSDLAIKAAKGVGFGVPAFFGRRGLGYAGRKYNEWTGRLLETKEGEKVGFGKKAAFAILNPVNFFKGWEQRAQELSKISKETAAAGGREVSEQFLTGPLFRAKSYKLWRPGEMRESWQQGASLAIPYRQFVARKHENDFLKQYQDMRKETLMRAAVEAENLTGEEGEIRKISIVKAAAAQGYLDDLMRMKHFATKYTGSDNVVYSAETLNRFLFGYLGHGEQAMRFMGEDMEDLGKKVRHFEYMGHAYYDPKDGKWKRGMEKIGTEKVKRGKEEKEIEVLKNEHQVQYSVGEFAKLGGRDRVAAAPHNFTVLRAEKLNADGSFMEDELDKSLTYGRADGTFDNFNQSMLQKMDSDVLREVQHAQERLKRWILSREAKPIRPDSGGEVIIEDKEHFEELKKVWDINQEFVKGLYTKALGLKGDDRTKLDGVKVYWAEKDEDGNIVSEHHEVLGKATFQYNENPPRIIEEKQKPTIVTP